ncbi:MAG: hypothetical protein ACREV0_12545, partial [Burkholderiales bacterium]
MATDLYLEILATGMHEPTVGQEIAKVAGAVDTPSSARGIGPESRCGRFSGTPIAGRKVSAFNRDLAYLARIDHAPVIVKQQDFNIGSSVAYGSYASGELARFVNKVL